MIYIHMFICQSKRMLAHCETNCTYIEIIENSWLFVSQLVFFFKENVVKEVNTKKYEGLSL